MVARVQIHAHQVKVLSGMSPVLLDQLSGMSSVEVCEETLCSMIDVSSLGIHVRGCVSTWTIQPVIMKYIILTKSQVVNKLSISQLSLYYLTT